MFRIGVRILSQVNIYGDSLSKVSRVPNFRGRQFNSSSRFVKHKKSSSLLIGVLTGCGIGAGYTLYNFRRGPDKAVLNPEGGQPCNIVSQLPNVRIARKIKYNADLSGLELVLFQYPTCPFCCKVRAFLDAHGLSYDVVEVNPVLRQQLKWTDYKKVPILLVKVKDGSYLQLNDSSMIISAITSYLYDPKDTILEVSNFYPSISYSEDGKIKSEILNRYFLMFKGNLPKGTTKESVENERKWRKWADDTLVHTLSPNVYRTTNEALQAFNWFSKVGEWERLFPAWEQNLIVYAGAAAMWLIGKRLKRRHNLKEDVRESLYDACNQWLRELKYSDGPFHGGHEPNLADLAVYGVLTSIEGCDAFSDLLSNTKISPWFSSMKMYVTRHGEPA